MSSIKVTACLLKYERPAELEAIIKDLKRYDFIDEILVRDNKVEQNIINYGRYTNARIAKNDIIYTQDDDCIVNNLQELYDAFDGTAIVNNIKPYHLSIYTGKDSIVGWGTLFDRRWSCVLNRYIRKFGEDFTFYRETDRIFTSLADVPIKRMAADITDFPSAHSSTALWKQVDHEFYKRDALNKCKELA